MRFFRDEQIEKIRRGYYSAVYFNRTKEILLAQKNFKKVTMQVFQKNEGSILCGVEEVREAVQAGTGYWDPPVAHRLRRGVWIDKSKDITIESLDDGDGLNAWETVMHITGPYAYIAPLESIYLGILARRTLVATNVKKAVEAAHGKSVVFFADRFDNFLNQKGDGIAAKTGGASAICTEAMGERFGAQPVGTLPHSLIAIYGGNTIIAAKQFAQRYPEVPLIVLVDFENDCVRTSVEVARALKERLWGVRIDTAENLVDESLLGLNPIQGTTLKGVNPTLVKNVRKALDSEGFDRVKIVVSGGFDETKIRWFEGEKTPVDMYGVGSALLKGNNDFTADVVLVEGKPVSKVGREFKENKKLKRLL